MKRSSRQYELLSDLAKLLKKHGRETFHELASLLKDPEFSGELATTLEAISESAPKKPPKRKRPTAKENRERFRRSLVELRAALVKYRVDLPVEQLEEVHGILGKYSDLGTNELEQWSQLIMGED